MSPNPIADAAMRNTAAIFDNYATLAEAASADLRKANIGTANLDRTAYGYRVAARSIRDALEASVPA